MKKIKCMISILVLFAGPQIYAFESEQTDIVNKTHMLDIFLNLGANLRSGYLTTEDSKTAYNLAFHIAPRESGYFSLELINDSFKHDTGEFPFPNNSNVRVSGFAFLANVGGNIYSNTKAYFGIGIGKFDLSTDDNKYEQSYGSYVYQGAITHILNEKWMFGYKIQYWNVEFTNNDKITFGEIRGHYLTLGYRM